ncbi:MAG: OmpA family protein [Deltaproteobacteria bacterium]|nr:OmpA family protein [Deltaproteobacteria bacterium]
MSPQVAARRTWAWGLTAALALAPLPAAAQLGADTGTGNNLDVEHLAPMPLGLVNADRTRAQRWGEYTVGLYLHYARNPLVLFADRLQVGEVVAHRLSMDVVGTLGILSWLDLTLAVPMSWWQTGDAVLPTGDLTSIGMRDLRISPKLTALRQEWAGVGLAVVPAFSLPTGDADAFLGSGNLTFSPHLIVDRSFDVLWGLRFSVAGGVKIRPRSALGNIEIDDELFYTAGAGVGLPDLGPAHPEAVAELSGATRLAEPFQNREQNPLLARGALRVGFDVASGHRIIALGGVSVGLTKGYGAPDAQVFLGVAYQRWLADRDGDGILDDDDACPDDPEDFDDFEDADGCPEPDNDRDGIPDVTDACPNDPEDFDGFEDTDGCPDPDNDRDGIPDVTDKCPNDPEDKDGFEDEDGCPDPDDDRDGIPDALDKCPQEKETINGVDDEDGCPDEGDTHVEVTSEKVTIDTRVNFDFDSDRIRSDSFDILNQVALTLQANLQLKLIRIEGHTDSQGADDYNLELSQRRAEAVMTYLVGRGVDSKRLEAVGYGEMRPLVPGTGEAVWAKNRRVEFTILSQGEGEDGGAQDIQIQVE